MVCESWAARELWLLSAVSQGSACLTGKIRRVAFKMKVAVTAAVTENHVEITLEHSFNSTTKRGQAHNMLFNLAHTVSCTSTVQ